MDKEREDFIKEREERYNGKLTYSTFGKYIGDARGSKLKGISGLLYIINKTLYFEDFAPAPSILTINQKSTYKKFEFNIISSNIDHLIEVREQDALSAIRNKGVISPLEPAKNGFFWRLINQTLLEIEVTNGKTMYFDCLKNDLHKTEILKYLDL